MNTYEIQVCRTYYALAIIEVEAHTEEEAKTIALDHVEDFGDIQCEDPDVVISCSEIPDED